MVLEGLCLLLACAWRNSERRQMAANAKLKFQCKNIAS